MDSDLKQKLESLCWINGWSYGIFWRFDQRNPMLLRVEDAYCEEQMQAVIDHMLLQAHTLGQGIIGQMALTVNPLWVFLDSAHDTSQDESELLHQFMSGIKTILVIPMGTQGVLQFGSTRTVLENPEILNQARNFFNARDAFHRQTTLGNTPSLVPRMFDHDELFASALSSESPNYGNLEHVSAHKMNNISVHDFPHVFREEDNFETNLLDPKTLDDDHMKSLQDCGCREQNFDISSQPEGSDDEVLTCFSNNSSCITSCSFENYIPSPKRRRIESTSSSSSCWMGAETSVFSSSKKLGRSIKVTKKRAKQGEGTRSRHTDRQLILDRIKELRKIIPRGAKCSIDELLDLTVKNIIFLQSVTERLKQCHELKLIDTRNRLRLGENTRGGNGATWAYEMGDKTMFCPIIIKDLTPPGQMLIEIVCEERGCFLEIVGLIKDLGVSILKAAMEIREGKVWAHFIVEANRNVTRLKLFWSLMKLLDQPEASGIAGSANDTENSLDRTSPFPVPDGFASTLR